MPYNALIWGSIAEAEASLVAAHEIVESRRVRRQRLWGVAIGLEGCGVHACVSACVCVCVRAWNAGRLWQRRRVVAAVASQRTGTEPLLVSAKITLAQQTPTPTLYSQARPLGASAAEPDPSPVAA